MTTVFETPNPNYQSEINSSFAKQSIMDTLGANLHSVIAGEVQIEMPFSEHITQQHGFLHAGVVSTLIDSACGYAAYSLMPANSGVLTIEFKVNLLAPAKGERFIAIGKVKKPGRTITVTEGEMIAINGSSQKVVASMTATVMTISNSSVKG